MPEDPLSRLRAADVRFLRITWCDNANVIRAKALHVPVAGDAVNTGIGITVAQQALPVMYDAVVPGSGLGPVGEARLVPDWSTLTPLPFAPGHARVMGDMTLAGQPWALCPREFVRRVMTDAARDGLHARAAFENEFFLVRPTADGIEPADDTVYAAVTAFDRNRAVIDELVEMLAAQNVPVEAYYPESGPGQQELPTRYAAPLAAADRQVVFRETAHAVAHRHGLRATFLPKVFDGKAGSGCHLHLSLWRDGQNLFPDPKGPGGLSAVGRAFVAGILEHLPALAAILAPTPNSYRRLKPHFWSGAFRCWGPDNREAAIRVPSGPPGEGATHFEIKTADATANPYLAVGAAIAAGLDGVRRGLDPGPPLDVDPGSLPDDERAARGIEPLPATLAEAISRLEHDAVLMSALGPELAKAYLAVRRFEWEKLKDLDLAAEVKLLLERY